MHKVIPFFAATALLSIFSSGPIAEAQTNRPSGTLVSWDASFLPYVEPGTRFSAIATGEGHTVALTSKGAVVAWGANMQGQATVPLAAQAGVVAVALGLFH